MSLGDYATIDTLEEAKMTMVGLVVMLLKVLEPCSLSIITLAGSRASLMMHLSFCLISVCVLCAKDMSLWLPVLFVAIETSSEMSFW